MSSIFADMNEIARLAGLKPVFESLCSKCGEKLEHEPSQPACHDEPGHESGWWCSNCQEWDDE